MTRKIYIVLFSYTTLIVSGSYWNLNKMQYFPYDNWTY